MTVQTRAARVLVGLAMGVCLAPPALAQGKVEYKVLSTTKTSTMQKEMQRAKDMKTPARYEYRLLATSKTSTMQKELSEAGDQGFEFVGLTVAKTLMGGDEVVSILRRKTQ